MATLKVLPMIVRYLLAFSIIGMSFSAAVLQAPAASLPSGFAPAALVKDINPGLDVDHELGSFPHYYTKVENNIFFVARDSAHGQELWKTDGTPDSTVLVKDIIPGSESSSIEGLTSTGHYLFFFTRPAFASEYHWDLWKSDGTANGTVCIKKDLFIRYANWPALIQPVSFDGNLFFSASLDDHTFYLWRSDGTTDGTIPIKGVTPYSEPTSFPSQLITVENTLYYVVTDGYGSTIWKSDGTEDGTIRIYVRSGRIIGSTISFNGLLLFLMHGGNKAELWQSNGTLEGTILVKSFGDPSNGDYVGDAWGLYNAGSKVFFFVQFPGYMELWISNATGESTLLIKQIPRSPANDYQTVVLSQLNENIFFSVRYVGTSISSWLYTSDGTPEGTIALKSNIYFSAAATVDGITLFLDYSSPPSLWASNGTISGTVLIKSFTPSTQDSALGGLPPRPELITTNNYVLFGCDAGSFGRELWHSDGTTAGTQVLKNIFPVLPRNSSPDTLTTFDDALYFSAQTVPNGRELWRSDGTDAGTFMVKDIYPGPDSSLAGLLGTEMKDINGNLFFDTWNELWKSDGTSTGTVMLKDNMGTNIYDFTEMENKLFFLMPDGLWQSNGTTATTTSVRAIDCSPYLCEFPQNLTKAGNQLFFTVQRYYLDDENDHIFVDRQLWKSDGTYTGTQIIPTTLDINLYSMIDFNDLLFFIACSGPWPNCGLWQSDGSITDAQLISSAINFSSDTKPVVVNGRFFFAGGNSEQGMELWSSDGTTTGTVQVKDIFSGTNSSYPSELTAAGNQLLFTADDGIHGRELWVSDGTTEGTHLVRDILPGTASGVPSGLKQVIPGWVLFSANDGQSGVELWQSDGTFTGTQLIQDIFPGIGSSLPTGFTVAGTQVFFSATEPSTGNELWAMNIAAITQPRAYDLLQFTPVNTPLQGTLHAFDPQSLPITYTLVADGSQGSVVITDPATGAFTYTPNQNAAGIDSFTFQVSNGAQESNIATVTIEIYAARIWLPFVQK